MKDGVRIEDRGSREHLDPPRVFGWRLRTVQSGVVSVHRKAARFASRIVPSILDPRSSIRFLFLYGASASANAQSPDIVAGGLLQATLGLALVLGMIVAIAWVAKRLAPGALRGTGVPLTIVASQSVGQRERVVVIEVADQWLVLGVAPGRVSALSTMPKATLPTSSASTTTPFAAALARALGRRQ